jgi:hypothetical protein
MTETSFVTETSLPKGLGEDYRVPSRSEIDGYLGNPALKAARH